MTKFLLSVLFNCVVLISLRAQDYTPAQIYTRNGDTIICQLKVEASYTNTGNFNYLLEGEKKSTKIFKEDIDSILVASDTYVFLRIHYKYAAGYDVKIYQKIEEGRLSLYAKSYEQTKVLSPGSGSLSGSGSRYQEYFIKKEGITKVQKIGRLGFRRKLLQYVDRNDALFKKLKNKEYKYNDIPLIISEYNAWYKQVNP